MLKLRKSWILILLLLVAACSQEEPEATPAEENATPSATATAENETPAASPSPTERTTTTPTLRATSPSTETAAQLKPISNAIFIRSGPGEQFENIGLLYEDETAAVLSVDDFAAWFEIRTDDGQEGWVAASVTELVEGQIAVATATPAPISPKITADPETTRLRVTINSAYIRSGPGQNYPVIDSVARGSTLTVLGYAQNGGWFNVRLSGDRSGWIGADITEPVGGWTLEEVNPAATVPAPPPTPQNNCDPAYPTVCIPSPPPDLDCRDIPYRSFTVLPDDPHLFDGNKNGVGCEPVPE